MLFRIFSIGVLTTSLVACGEELASVAVSSELRVSFSQKLVQASFQLNDQYRIPLTKKIAFGNENETLAKVFVSYDEEKNKNEIGAVFSAEAIHKKNWPTSEMTRFPNWSRLPKTVVSRKLNNWEIEQDEISVASLFQNEPQLIIGGAFLSSEFRALPLGFLGTQYFYDEYGNINASMTIAGPTLTASGGLYFLGNFGSNPFMVPELMDSKRIHLTALPLEVQRQGYGIIDDFSPQDILLNFSRQLDRFL